jgi:hypothetical protein
VLLPKCNTGRFRIPASCHLPPASLSLCHHGYNSNPPLIFMRRLGLQVMTQTLLVLLIQLKSHRNRTVQIFNTISNKLHLGEYSAILKLSCMNLHVHQT